MSSSRVSSSVGISKQIRCPLRWTEDELHHLKPHRSSGAIKCDDDFVHNKPPFPPMTMLRGKERMGLATRSGAILFPSGRGVGMPPRAAIPVTHAGVNVVIGGCGGEAVQRQTSPRLLPMSGANWCNSSSFHGTRSLHQGVALWQLRWVSDGSSAPSVSWRYTLNLLGESR